jgi:hypothetical protein
MLNIQYKKAAVWVGVLDNPVQIAQADFGAI